MAFNLGALKALFSKLKPAAKAVAPAADDIVKGVANYGDDAASIVANYGDDAARAVTKYGDDVLKSAGKVDGADNLLEEFFSKSFDDYGLDDQLPFGFNAYGQSVIPLGSAGAIIDGKTFKYPTRYSPQNALKEKLLDKRIGVATRPETLKISNISGHPDPDFTFPKTTSVLGDVTLGTRRIGNGVNGVYDIEGVLNPHYVFNQTLDRPLDTTGMVLQSPELLRGIDYDTDNFAFGIRPHKNTALGRWFAKNNPNYGWDMEEPFYF